MKTLTLTSLVLVSIGLSACGKSSGSGQASPTLATASGSAMLGPVSSATIEATDSVSGDSLGSATTASDGSYSLAMQTLPTSGVAYLTMSGGSYSEEANPGVVLSGPTLHAVMTSVSGSVSVAITPLTEIAYQLYLKGDTNANTDVASIFFGTAITNVTKVIPANPSSQLPATTAGTYEVALAQISKAAVSNSETSAELAASYASTIVSSGASGLTAALNTLNGYGTSNLGITTAPGLTPPSNGAASVTVAFGGYTVPSVVSNAIFWMHADAISGYTNGAAVNSWADTSTSNLTCTLHNGGVAPTYVASSQGGKPALSFVGDSGGNNEYNCNDSGANGPFSLQGSGSTALTVMFVASGSTMVTVGNQGIVHNNVISASVQDNSFGTPDVAGWLQMATLANSLYETISASMPSGSVAGSVEYDMTQTGSNRIAFWENGISGTTLGIDSSYLNSSPYTGGNNSGSGAGAAATASVLSVGGRFTGNIQEILIFPSALDNTDRSAVECYFSKKYLLSLSGC